MTPLVRKCLTCSTLQSFNNAFTAQPLERGFSTTLELAGNQASYVLHFVMMNLLATKLFTPPQQPWRVARDILTRRLSDASSRKLILVSAAAGFGKTTLISEWLATQKTPHAWLSLDANDNELRYFLSYLNTALQTLQADIGSAVLPFVQSSQTPALEPLMTDLVNDLAGLEHDVLLVLDDYHVIQSQGVHDTLAFLLEHAPPTLHFVVITREDPPLPLPKLRVQRELLEIYAEDLRFDKGETKAFLNQIMRLSLSKDAINTLEQRTEGWIAGLQLAALSLQNEPDKAKFIEAFAGDDRFIMDYLASEVLERQTPQIQDFLLKTSALERLSASLCDAVTERTDSASLLQRLEQQNLFLIPLDHKRAWYRYHHLFADYLRHHLMDRFNREETRTLRHRAASWLWQHDLKDEAIQHLVEAAWFTEAAHYIESIGLTLLAQGQLSKLLGWLKALPAELFRERPLLCTLQAWVLNLMGQTDEMEACLQLAERALPTGDATLNKRIEGSIATIRAGAARKRHKPEEAIGHLRKALELLPKRDRLLRCSANFNLGSTYLEIGDLRLAEETLQDAWRDGRASGNVYGVLAAMSYQADGYVLQGRLTKAVKRYEATIAHGLELNDEQPHPLASYAYVGLGQVRYEQNELAEAEHSLNQAIYLAERLGDATMLRRGLITLMQVKQAQGDNGALYSIEQHALNLARRYHDQAGEAYLEALQINSLLSQPGFSDQNAQWRDVKRWAQSASKGEKGGRGFQEDFVRLTLARAKLMQSRPEQALAYLAGLEEQASRTGHRDTLIKTLALRAVAEAAQNTTEQAIQTLKRALDLGVAEGYARTFMDHGLDMEPLLEQVAKCGIHVDYIAELLAAFSSVDGPISIRSRANTKSMLEPLTEREHQVLRLMAGGLKDKEIGRELSLTLNTIKWYARSIYDKLGVRGRLNAVTYAKEHDLL